VIPENTTLFNDYFSYMNTGVDAARDNSYPDKTDLILYGILGLNKLLTYETLSSTIVMIEKQGQKHILGVLINSPEPIYDICIEHGSILPNVELLVDGKITAANAKKYV